MQQYTNNMEGGWYNPKKVNAAPEVETVRVRRKVFRYSSFRIPSVIFCILGAASIGLGVTNLVATSQYYYTDGSGTWVGCKQTGESIIAPNNAIRGAVFWVFACIGIIIGVWCFVTGVWTGCVSRQSDQMLNVLHKVLIITFAGCFLEAVFAAVDIIASFSCLDTANMDGPSNIKVSMPFFLVVLASLQIILTGVLYSLVRRLRRFRASPYNRRSNLKPRRQQASNNFPQMMNGQRMNGQMMNGQMMDNMQGGFNRFMGRPTYNNFMTYSQ